MPIPAFYHTIRPVLEIHKDKNVYNASEIEAKLAFQLHLTEAEQTEMLPSGGMTRLRNRTYWATTYLRQAQLLKAMGRGQTQITARGLQFLPNAPDPIKEADLKRFPEFAAFKLRSKSVALDTSTTQVSDSTSIQEATPEETINVAYAELRDALAQEILDRIKAMPPAFFEQLIVQLMLSLGYGSSAEDARKTLGKSGDGGVDGVINQDKLGLDKIYLQAKRWNDTTVGSPQVQAFVGALAGKGVKKGVFITTSTSSNAAINYCAKSHDFKVALIDGDELARLMIDYNLGVSPIQRLELKRIDSDFFSLD